MSKAVPNTAHLAVAPSAPEVKDTVVLTPENVGDLAAALELAPEVAPLAAPPVPVVEVLDAPVLAPVVETAPVLDAPETDLSLDAPVVKEVAKPGLPALKRPCDFILTPVGQTDQITARHISTGFLFEGTVAEFNIFLRS